MKKNNNFKILMIGTSDNVGGAARVGWDLGRELRRRGWWVRYIVAYKKMDSDVVYELKKSSLTELMGRITDLNITPLSRHFRDFLFANDIDFGASDEIFNHPWYKEAEIVHLHNLHGGYFKLENLLRICKEKKVVWTLHDMWSITAHCVYCYDCGNWNKGKHHTPGYRKYGSMLWDNSEYLWNKKKNIYSKSRIFLIPSSQWLNGYVRKSILKDKPSKVILNGVDTNIFKPSNKRKVRSQLKLPQEKIIIAFINQGGVEDPRKGGGYFYQISKHFENNKKLLFLCIGGGKRRERKENILYVPFIFKVKDLAKYYKASDLFLFTSLADNCPLVPLEALSSGLPVVSFDVGGVKEEIMHKKNGYIAKYKDAKDLINGISFILKLGKARMEKMSKENRKNAVAKFSHSVLADKTITIYQHLFDK